MPVREETEWWLTVEVSAYSQVEGIRWVEASILARGHCGFWGLGFKKVEKERSYVHWLHGLAGGMVIFRGSLGRLPPAPHLVLAAVGSSPKGVLYFFW